MSAIKDCMNKAKGYKGSGKKGKEVNEGKEEKSAGALFKRMRKGK